MTTLVAPMSRRKYVITARMNERDYPYIVELALPPGGFRARSDAMLAFHRERTLKSVAAWDEMTTGNSTCGTASPIRPMPVRSVIDLVASG